MNMGKIKKKNKKTPNWSPNYYKIIFFRVLGNEFWKNRLNINTTTTRYNLFTAKRKTYSRETHMLDFGKMS